MGEHILMRIVCVLVRYVIASDLDLLKCFLFIFMRVLLRFLLLFRIVRTIVIVPQPVGSRQQPAVSSQ